MLAAHHRKEHIEEDIGSEGGAHLYAAYVMPSSLGAVVGKRRSVLQMSAVEGRWKQPSGKAGAWLAACLAASSLICVCAKIGAQ